MNKINDIFYNMLPTLDLHGYDKESAKVATNDFVLENQIQNKLKIIIIHGIGTGIVKEAVHQTLKQNKKVLKYEILPTNIGCTIVYLNPLTK